MALLNKSAASAIADAQDLPVITRVRHELRRRTLDVVRVERMPPSMVRIVLSGAELEGFNSLGFDDHIKLFFPTGLEAEGVPPPMRDFTPRRYDSAAGELWIDFFLHEAGPAATWAAQASVGQTLQCAGPKGSFVIALEGIDLHLLVGDETALPAIARRLEELPASTKVLVVIEVEADAARPTLTSRAALRVVWAVRDWSAGQPAQAIIAGLRALEFTPHRCFAWVACESKGARAVRAYLRDERAFDKKWIKAAGYWQQGAVGSHDVVSDETGARV